MLNNSLVTSTPQLHSSHQNLSSPIRSLRAKYDNQLTVKKSIADRANSLTDRKNSSLRSESTRYSRVQCTLDVSIRETLQDLISRKLITKYVDSNPYFVNLQSSTDLPPIKIKSEAALAYGSLPQPVPEESAAEQMVKYIEMEVKKMLNQKTKVSQKALNELEQKLQLEIYLREKKAAILLDRRQSADNVDAESHLSIVQKRLPQVVKNDQQQHPLKIQRSICSSVESLHSLREIQSCISQRDLHQRSLEKPLAVVAEQQDEWSLIQQYQLIRDYQERQEQRRQTEQNKINLCKELDRQQAALNQKRQKQREQENEYLQKVIETNQEAEYEISQKQQLQKQKISDLYLQRNKYAQIREQLVSQQESQRRAEEKQWLVKVQSEINEQERVNQEKKEKKFLLMRQIMAEADELHKEKQLKKLISKQEDQVACEKYANKLEQEHRQRVDELSKIKNRGSNNVLNKVHRIERVNEEKMNRLIEEYQSKQDRRDQENLRLKLERRRQMQDEVNRHCEVQLGEHKQRAEAYKQEDRQLAQRIDEESMRIERAEQQKQQAKLMRNIENQKFLLKQRLEKSAERAVKMSSHEQQLNRDLLEKAQKEAGRHDIQSIVQANIKLSYFSK